MQYAIQLAIAIAANVLCEVAKHYIMRRRKEQ